MPSSRTPRVPIRLVDLAKQGWLGFVDGWRERLLARHGGYWFVDGERSRFCPAPFVGAIGGWLTPDHGWVASSLGLMFRWDGTTWTALSAPVLSAKFEAKVFGDRSRVWAQVSDGKYGSMLVELRDGGHEPSDLGIENVTVVTSDSSGMIVGTGAALHRLEDGRTQAFFAASEIPGDGRWILDACPSVLGGLLIVDNAGSLVHRHEDGTVELLRRGTITESLQHTYPDPEPDVVVDQVQAATVLPTGEARLTRRRATWLIGADGTERLVRDGGRGVLVEGVPAAPMVSVRSLWDGFALLALGRTELAVPLGPPGVAYDNSRPVFSLGVERWQQLETLTIFSFGYGTRVPFDPPVKTLLEPAAGGSEMPHVVDLEGTVHRFNGATFDPLPVREWSDIPFGEPKHSSRVGERLFLADERRLLGGWPPPPEKLRQLREPKYIERLLAAGIADLVVRSIPLAIDDAVPQLWPFQQVGRTAAGIWLARLCTGGDTSKAGAEYGLVAARVMAGLDDVARCFVLLDGERILGWIAAQAKHALVVFDGSESERMSRAMAEGAGPAPRLAGLHRLELNIGGETHEIELDREARLLSLVPDGDEVLVRTGPRPESMDVRLRLPTTIEGELPYPEFGLQVMLIRPYGRLWVVPLDPPLPLLGDLMPPRSGLDWPPGVVLHWRELAALELRVHSLVEPPSETVRCPSCAARVCPRALPRGHGGRHFGLELVRRGIPCPVTGDLECPECRGALDRDTPFLGPSVYELYRRWLAERGSYPPM